MGNLKRDLAYGLRTLRNNPVFTLVAVATLALGIGVNATMFSIVNGVLLNPLPYDEAERLVLLRVSVDGEASLPSISPPEAVDLVERTSVFESLATIRDASSTLTGRDGSAEPVQIQMANVTANFFSVLRIEPFMGTDFSPEHDTPQAAPAVLISHRLWQRQFGGDDALVGQTLVLDGRATTVLGILPADAQLLLPREAGLPKDLDAYQPFGFDFRSAPRFRWMRGLARLRPGIDAARAQEALDVLASDLIREHSQYAQQPFEYRVVPLHADLVRPVRTRLLVLFGAVGCVLLIACGNVANLLLARAANRERELGIRVVLGAGRARLIHQMLTESSLLAAAGGALGLVLAASGMRLVMRLAPPNLPRFDAVAIDARVLGFAIGLSLLTVVLFALFPALQSSRGDLHETLKSGSRAAGGAESARLRRLLVTAQIALSLVLLVFAGLMVQAFLVLQRVDPGFEPAGLVTFQVSIPPSRYPTEATGEFFQRLVAGLESQPGIDAAGGSFPLPMSGRFWTSDYAYDDETWQNWGSVESDNHVVLPGYFETVGARLVAGRFPTWSDNVESRPVVVVDEQLAAKAWPGESAVGKELGVLLGGGNTNTRGKLEVIGVVEHIRQEHPALDGREQTFMLPVHWPFWTMPMTVRSHLPQEQVAGLIRSELAKIDPQVAAYQVRGMGSYIDEVLASNRFAMFLMGLFAALALVLAAIGLYGTMAYSVAQRRHELGIRMALGAAPRDLVLMVVGQGLALTAVGVGLGLAASLVLSRLVASFLYEVSPFHLPTYAGLTCGLVLLAALASWVPARRAIRRPPVEALSGD